MGDHIYSGTEVVLIYLCTGIAAISSALRLHAQQQKRQATRNWQPVCRWDWLLRRSGQLDMYRIQYQRWAQASTARQHAPISRPAPTPAGLVAAAAAAAASWRCCSQWRSRGARNHAVPGERARPACTRTAIGRVRADRVRRWCTAARRAEQAALRTSCCVLSLASLLAKPLS